MVNDIRSQLAAVKKKGGGEEQSEEEKKGERERVDMNSVRGRPERWGGPEEGNGEGRKGGEKIKRV